MLAAICLSSFLAWPALDYPFYLSFKYLCLLLVLVAFGLALWRLRRWQLCFWLNELGEGQFEPGSSFELSGKPWVSPFVVTFTYQGRITTGVAGCLPICLTTQTIVICVVYCCSGQSPLTELIPAQVIQVAEWSAADSPVSADDRYYSAGRGFPCGPWRSG